MLKLLDRYIGEEVVLYTVGFYAAFLIFMMGNDLFLLLQQIQDKQIPGTVVARMLLLHSPSYMTWGLPASVLFGVLVGVGRLANDNEIMAMKTSGISLARIQRSVLIIGLVSSLGVWWIGEKVAPPTFKSWAKLFYGYGVSSTNERIQPQRFLKGAKNDQYFYFQTVDIEKHTVRGVFMIQMKPGAGHQEKTLVAQSGEVTGDTLVLHGGVATDYGPNGFPQSSGPFEKMEIDVGGNVIQNIRPAQQAQSMGIQELRHEIPLQAQSGMTEKQLTYYQTELYFRYSLPLAAFVFAIMAFPLAARAARGGRFMSLFFALFFYGLFYVLISGSKILGYNGVLPPMVAGWMTTGTMVLISIVLLIRGER